MSSKIVMTYFEKITWTIYSKRMLRILEPFIIATGVRPEDFERKQAKLKPVISCFIFYIC